MCDISIQVSGSFHLHPHKNKLHLIPIEQSKDFEGSCRKKGKICNDQIIPTQNKTRKRRNIEQKGCTISNFFDSFNKETQFTKKILLLENNTLL